MRFRPPPRRRMGEPILPMINVVFLLLIFFLMTATLAPPAPFELDLPEGTGPVEPGGDTALYVGPDGTLAYGAARGAAVFAALAALPPGGALEIRADAGTEAARIAALLPRLSEAGISQTRLVLAGER